MQKTIVQLEKEFREIARAHLQINDFFFGSFLFAYSQKRVKNCCLIVDVSSASPVSLKGAGSYIDFVLTITVCDQVYNDNSNRTEVISDTARIVEDIKNVLRSQRWASFSRIIGSPVATLFEESGPDNVTGFVTNLTLRVVDLGDYCAAPLENYSFDTVAGNSCPPGIITKDGVFEQYLYGNEVFNYSEGAPATVTVNSNEFGTVSPGDSINVPVQYVSGSPVGTISGGVVLVPDPVTDIAIVSEFSIGIDTVEFTAISFEEGTFTSETLTNVTSVLYLKNANPATLPFSIVAGDVVSITITRTNPAAASAVQINGTY